jgi:hypothetical protein
MLASALRRLSSLLLISLGASQSAGCPARTISKVDPTQDVVEVKEIPVIPKGVDLLFVIDDSRSMLANQQNLIDNFPNFVEVLENISDGRGGVALPDIHIGVVTSSVGPSYDDQGLLQRTQWNGNSVIGDCGMLHEGQRFLSDVAGPNGRIRNYDGNLRDAFSCIAAVGTAGDGFEAHLESARQALLNPANAGFLRDDAYLAIVVIADEDDCSPPPGSGSPTLWDDSAATVANLGVLQSFRCFEYGVTCRQDVRPDDATAGPNPAVSVTDCVPSANGDIVADINEFAEFFREIKADPRDVFIGNITGVGEDGEVDTTVQIGQIDPTSNDEEDHWFSLEPSCTVSGRPIEARPAIRLDGFRRLFPDRNFSASICNANLTPALVDLAGRLGDFLGNPCFSTAPIDKNEVLGGLQAECAISYVDDAAHEEVMSACDASATNRPCWRIIEDQANCPLDVADHLALEFMWVNDDPLDVTITAECATEAVADDIDDEP